jgi:hypothetical protein
LAPDSETPEGPGLTKKKKKHRKDEPSLDRGENAVEALIGSGDGHRKWGFKLKGRLFALAELSHRHETIVGTSGQLEPHDRDALDLSVQSARVGFEYQSPLPFLTADLELELAGKVKVRDAYLQAGDSLFVRAGQFKMPSARLELESPWTVPVVRRGLIHDLMNDWMDIGGRRPGVAIGYKGDGSLKPRLTLGAFQGVTLKSVLPGERDVRLLDEVALDAQTYAARAQVSLASVALGAWYEYRITSVVVGKFDHMQTFGLDATLEQRFEHGALRAWVDGSGGRSPYVNAEKPDAIREPHPWFVAGRALLAYRFGGLEKGAPYVEPFGLYGLMDPDTEVVTDLFSDAAVGLAVGYWDRARLTLQGEMTKAQRNYPTGFLLNQTPDHLGLLLQAGARF